MCADVQQSGPTIIHLPPHAATPWGRAFVGGGIAGITVGALTLLIMMLVNKSVQHSSFETAAVCIGLAAVMPLVFGLDAWSQRRRIARFTTRCAQIELTPLAKELAALYSERLVGDVVSLLGRRDRFVERLLAEPAADRRFARVVCCEPVLMPEVGNARFEPFIIRTGFTPTWELLFAAAAGGLWAISYLFPIVPIVTRIGRFAGLFAVFCGAPVVALAVFRLLVRTRYIRIAPGQVDILTYSAFRRTPRCRRIPLDANTAVIFRAMKNNERLSLAVIVRDRKILRVVDFPGQPPGAVEHVWWAVHAPWQPLPLPSEALTD